jgi:hypothetical protein
MRERFGVAVRKLESDIEKHRNMIAQIKKAGFASEASAAVQYSKYADCFMLFMWSKIRSYI